MVALDDMKTLRRVEQARRLSDVRSETLRAMIHRAHEQGREDGPMAEACRQELARRGEQA